MELINLIYIILMGAIISAILSTVDSVLLSGASILSHNFFVRILSLDDDVTQMRCSRVCVMILGLIAYLCALYADRIRDLVEVASSFGSAGLLPVVVFGLFSRIGGPRAAGTAFFFGMIGWVTGMCFELTAPYTVSILIATMSYLGVAYALNEHREPSV